MKSRDKHHLSTSPFMRLRKVISTTLFWLKRKTAFFFKHLVVATVNSWPNGG